MGKVLSVLIFAVLAVIVSVSINDAYATQIFTLDQSTCTGILYPGSWDATTNTCLLTGAISFGTNSGPHVLELVIPSGNTLQISGTGGFFTDFDTITNNGTINLVNQGGLAVTNGGVLNNNGVLTNNGPYLQNGAGTINNNIGATINNNGRFTNYFSTINNRGTLNAGSDLENQQFGTINNICPGVITGNIVNQGGNLVNSCPQTITTSTTVSSSQNPSTFGQSITFTATISPNTATGTVQFQTDGANLGSPATVSGGSATSIGISSLSSGPHTIAAIYTGTGNFVGSTGTLSQTVNSLTCPAGQFLSGNSCVPAPPGSYVPLPGATSATLCPVGTFTSLAGQTQCTPAPAGSYVQSTGSTSSIQCAAGTFQPNTSSASCNPADPGNYVSGTGATSETQCLAGTYQPNSGATSCIPAPAGSFVAGAGATSSTLCPVGAFTSTEGNTTCTPSPAGSYVGSAGATSSTLCALGSYQPNTGQSSCTLAQPGFFVSISGATQQTQCTLGTTSDVPGSTSCHAVSTVGKVTGGGNIGTDQNFGFDVSSKDGRTFKGHLEYHAKTSHIDLDSANMTQLFVDSSMTHAIFAGQATTSNHDDHDDKKSPSQTLAFLINVTDPDKKGDRDTLSIIVTDSSGSIVYQNSGTVQGHIEIHNVDIDDNGNHGDDDQEKNSK